MLKMDESLIAALHLGPLTIKRPIAGEIKAYEENGRMAPVVWFKVINNQGHIIQRVNGAHVHIVEYVSR